MHTLGYVISHVIFIAMLALGFAFGGDAGVTRASQMIEAHEIIDEALAPYTFARAATPRERSVLEAAGVDPADVGIFYMRGGRLLACLKNGGDVFRVLGVIEVQGAFQVIEQNYRKFYGHYRPDLRESCTAKGKV